MLEVMGEPHIRTARSFGLPERTIVFRYALRIAVLPTVTLLGTGVGSLLSSAVFAEIVFNRPGIGQLVLGAVNTRNYPVVMGAVLVVVGSGLPADWIAPYDPLKLAVRERIADPSLSHLLGTDQLGRDILSRVIKGSQIALLVGLSATLLSLLGGLLLGLLAGYGPRWLDNLLLLLFDAVHAFPVIMLALAVVSLFGPNLVTL